MLSESHIIKGRGAQIQVDNPHLKISTSNSDTEFLDEDVPVSEKTKIVYEHAKSVVNKVPSPDIGLDYSMNPYQGCEHGCSYCYARPTHENWGYNAGIDFEQVIVVKKKAPQLLEKFINRKRWDGTPIMLSGNTDCYQPLEKKLELTRSCLEVFLKYGHPVGLITKNALLLRDLDILAELASRKLVHVVVSITTLNEDLRRYMEPRTSTGMRRLEMVKKLSDAGIPVSVNIAPVIPALNQMEIPVLLKKSAEMGALNANYILIRLNGNVKKVFHDWLYKSFPEKADKVISLIKQCRNGSLGDTKSFRRMKGEGKIAENIQNFFNLYKKKFFEGRQMPAYNREVFVKHDGKQMALTLE